ncbi:MAG: hypothetical protein QGG48_02045 [Desulfatiglandales bacterium]|nr:hypothetical protein [Desulfatiglandales bacterium]
MTQALFATDDLDEETQQLDELALGTFAIGGFLMKTKQYASKIDSEVRNLVADADKLKRTDTLEKTNKSLVDAFKTIASLHFLQRKMLMYMSLVSASGGAGIDRSYKILQKMEKKRR